MAIQKKKPVTRAEKLPPSVVVNTLRDEVQLKIKIVNGLVGRGAGWVCLTTDRVMFQIETLDSVLVPKNIIKDLLDSGVIKEDHSIIVPESTKKVFYILCSKKIL